jgi:hypothetical protein
MGLSAHPCNFSGPNNLDSLDTVGLGPTFLTGPSKVSTGRFSCYGMFHPANKADISSEEKANRVEVWPNGSFSVTNSMTQNSS